MRSALPRRPPHLSAASRIWRRVEDRLSGAGLGVHAFLQIARYDASVPAAWRSERLCPGAQTAMLVGNGGRALWDAFGRSPEFGSGPDPLDAYTRRVVTAAAGEIGRGLRRSRSRALFAFELHGGVHADFIALAQHAGLGARSRLGLLLHPQYGPWLALRAALLTDLPVEDESPVAPAAFDPNPAGFDPCCGCPAPCAEACPGLALAAARFDVARCSQHRAVDPDCAESCAARLACVVGPEHAYPPAALAHHMRHARLP